MTKKHFIALADEVRAMLGRGEISDNGVRALAAWCGRENGQFKAARWIGYIYGGNGPSGGRVAATGGRVGVPVYRVQGV